MQTGNYCDYGPGHELQRRDTDTAERALFRFRVLLLTTVSTACTAMALYSRTAE